MNVILATDGSAAAHQAEWFLSRIPFPEPIHLVIANVVLVPSLAHLRHEFPDSINETLDQYHDHAESLLDDEAARFDGINGTVETCLKSGHPADELVELARERGSDLIVLGARGRTPTQRFLLGSVSLKVARHAPCSVLVTRPPAVAHSSEHPLRVLLCQDSSESSRQTVRIMSRFHWGHQVEFTALAVVTPNLASGMMTYQKPQPLLDAEKRQAEEALAWTVDRLHDSAGQVRSELRVSESVAGEIVTVAEDCGADLIVVGHRGLSRMERFFLGSTSEEVLRHAPCSVWIVREQSQN